MSSWAFGFQRSVVGVHANAKGGTTAGKMDGAKESGRRNVERRTATGIVNGLVKGRGSEEPIRAKKQNQTPKKKMETNRRERGDSSS